jgi:hypothetical protein
VAYQQHCKYSVDTRQRQQKLGRNTNDAWCFVHYADTLLLLLLLLIQNNSLLPSTGAGS